jgi:hypothetical protein
MWEYEDHAAMAATAPADRLRAILMPLLSLSAIACPSAVVVP